MKIKKFRRKENKQGPTFLSNKSFKTLLSQFADEFKKHKEFYNIISSTLDSKELANPPLSEACLPLSNIAIKSTTKFSINPSLNDAPNNLLSTLTSRLLDLSVVRAEVAVLCFDTLPNILLPVHVFLLANLEQDFKVNTPAFRTLVIQWRAKKYLFKRKLLVRSPNARKRVKGQRLLQFYHNSKHFFYAIAQRFVSLVDSNEESDSELTFLYKTKLLAFVRSDFGTLRSLKSAVVNL